LEVCPLYAAPRPGTNESKVATNGELFLLRMCEGFAPE
jgi:hypothetical protein